MATGKELLEEQRRTEAEKQGSKPSGNNSDNSEVNKIINETAIMKANREVDVINIATPNGFHASQALECLDAKKHVVIEKPMALNKQDAEKVIFKALQVHKHVFAVMQNRYSPPSVWIKDLIESGKLGMIYMVQLNCYWNRDDRYYKADSWHGKKDLDGGTLFT